MSTHRDITSGDAADVYELTAWDSDIPQEWRYAAAEPQAQKTREECPLCQRPAQGSTPTQRTRAKVCDKCERMLFSGLNSRGPIASAGRLATFLRESELSAPTLPQTAGGHRRT